MPLDNIFKYANILLIYFNARMHFLHQCICAYMHMFKSIKIISSETDFFEFWLWMCNTVLVYIPVCMAPLKMIHFAFRSINKKCFEMSVCVFLRPCSCGLIFVLWMHLSCWIYLCEIVSTYEVCIFCIYTSLLWMHFPYGFVVQHYWHFKYYYYIRPGF